MCADPPSSTYRLQLHAGFTLDDAAGTVAYLAALGVSHLYCSPVLAAAPGSTHGYDVVDPGRVNPELGGDAARRRLLDAARRHGMGLVLDIVPNHVSVAEPSDNPWWWDLLRVGRDSPYAPFFDVDWAAGPLLLPVLGEPGDAERLELGERDGRPVLRYYEHTFPVAPGTGGGSPATVHARQHYRLVHWRRGGAELTYRRFFDVSGLAGVAVEEPRVFEAGHALVSSWLRAGELDGLRVDHPDGLADPQAYLQRLAGQSGWTVVEKILAPDEALPPSWPVAGTTGYEALRLVDGLFVDPAGREPLTELYAQLTGEPTDVEQIVRATKLAAALGPLRSETERLARLAGPALGTEAGEALSEALAEALAEVLAALPVYRTYLRPGEDGGDDGHHDAALLHGALTTARRHRPDLAGTLDALAPRLADPGDELCRRFQQTSGMVMAKGVEDTAFYRYHRLLTLTEVGGDPARFGVEPAEFHAAAARRERDWPASMTTVNTHDTKRSADVRTRLALLSEVPDAWAAAARRLHALAAPHRGRLDDNLLYLAHQTILGAWPIGADRLGAYLGKASREAKQHTSWTDPDPAYDADVQALAAGLLGDRDYVAAIEDMLAVLAPAQEATARAHLLVHLTQPGVPDIYQGCEVEARSLVDPDNRRPVDFTALAAGLAADAPRQHLVRALLTARRQGRFAPGCGYTPVDTASPFALAYRRGHDTLVVAGRLLLGLARTGAAGEDIALPAAPTGGWRDLLTGQTHGPRLALRDLLTHGGVVLVAS